MTTNHPWQTAIITNTGITNTSAVSGTISNSSLPPLDTIQGTEVYVEVSANKLRLVANPSGIIDDNDIKMELIQKLAVEMFKSNCVEFTKTIDQFNFETIYRARAFVVPDNKVKVLRLNGNIK